MADQFDRGGFGDPAGQCRREQRQRVKRLPQIVTRRRQKPRPRMRQTHARLLSFVQHRIRIHQRQVNMPQFGHQPLGLAPSGSVPFRLAGKNINDAGDEHGAQQAETARQHRRTAPPQCGFSLGKRHGQSPFLLQEGKAVVERLPGCHRVRHARPINRQTQFWSVTANHLHRTVRIGVLRPDRDRFM